MKVILVWKSGKTSEIAGDGRARLVFPSSTKKGNPWHPDHPDYDGDSIRPNYFSLVKVRKDGVAVYKQTA